MVQFLITIRRLLALVLLGSAAAQFAYAQTGAPSSGSAPCRIDAVDYMGWHAQQLSNQWNQLIFIPQNGGRLIQFRFAGHSYLFTNPEYAGKYFPPTQGKWFNYGGDKIWLLPEGNKDEQHWVGDSDLIDDGPFTFRKISEGHVCQIELTGPVDPTTGVQLSRTIQLSPESPRVSFHAVMKNVTGHPLEWSMQSVTQYDTSASRNQTEINPDMWGYTRANPASGYLERYHVRFGPAENPAVSVRDDGLFAVHYAHMAAELWIDSTAGWLAVVDASSQYAMLERMRVENEKPYPGKASVIFWTNGPEFRLNRNREPGLSDGEEGRPYYMEAELNSSLCRLDPGESCDLQTEWFPTRAGTEFHGVTEAGILIHPLDAKRVSNGNIRVIGSFGVFFPGRIVAHLYDEHGHSLKTAPLTDASPTDVAAIDAEIPSSASATRISLHLEDTSHLDRGTLGELAVSPAESSK